MSLSVPSSLIGPAAAFVRDYMSRYDGSHDFGHIRRVVRLARHIHSQEHQRAGADLGVVILAALLHDVGDKKYVSEGEDPTCMVRDVLAGKLGAEPALAERVQKICLGVSYSSEAKDPEGTERLVQEYPESIVQDADRLDALGAIGIGRAYAFGGAKNRSMDDSIEHFDDKLFKLEGMMKTETGKQMARERTERMRKFKDWWVEEATGPVESITGSEEADPLYMYDNWESI